MRPFDLSFNKLQQAQLNQHTPIIDVNARQQDDHQTSTISKRQIQVMTVLRMHSTADSDLTAVYYKELLLSIMMLKLLTSKQTKFTAHELQMYLDTKYWLEHERVQRSEIDRKHHTALQSQHLRAFVGSEHASFQERRHGVASSDVFVSIAESTTWKQRGYDTSKQRIGFILSRYAFRC